jgi:hypothetical protein
MSTTRTVTHADAEARLLHMVRGQVTTLYGHLVWRCADGRTWSIDNGPSLMLLCAIDQLMGPAHHADGAGGTGDA